MREYPKIQFVTDKVSDSTNLCKIEDVRFSVEASGNDLKIKPLTNPKLFDLCIELEVETPYPVINSDGAKYYDVMFKIFDGLILFDKLY